MIISFLRVIERNKLLEIAMSQKSKKWRTIQKFVIGPKIHINIDYSDYT